MGRPLFDQAQWILYNEAIEGLPLVFVNVSNMRARIVVNGEDVTDRIHDGEQLAEDAAWSFGGAVNISGIYPPTEEIMEELRRRALLPKGRIVPTF